MEIFRAGEHVSSDGLRVEFREQDLIDSARAYMETTSIPAPCVLGHPSDEANSHHYGVVHGLFASGRSLYAVAEFEEEFIDVIRAGRYKHVSASFYMPHGPRNPRPGTWFLRHVGFLGATPPALKGLEPLNFSAGGGGLVEFSEGALSPASLHACDHYRAAVEAAESIPGIDRSDVYRLATYVARWR